MVLTLIEKFVCGTSFETAIILTMLLRTNRFILVQWLPRGVDGTLENTILEEKKKKEKVTTKVLFWVGIKIVSMMRQELTSRKALGRDYSKIVVNASYAVVEVNSFKSCVSKDVPSVVVMS